MTRNDVRKSFHFNKTAKLQTMNASGFIGKHILATKKPFGFDCTDFAGFGYSYVDIVYVYSKFKEPTFSHSKDI